MTIRRSSTRLQPDADAHCGIVARNWHHLLPKLPPEKTDVARKPQEPPSPTTWSIYKVASKAVWLGTVEAPDKQTAIEKGAQEFKTEAWRLYAVARR
jgi:hypothetical protein